MKRILILSSILIAESCCSFIRWIFSDVYFSNSWRELSVVPPLGPCQPCNYSFGFGSSSATFEIQSSTSSSYFFELYPLTPLSDSLVFFDRTMEFQGTGSANHQVKNITIHAKIQSFPRDGVRYRYIIQIFQLGLFIDHTFVNSQYFLFISSIIYAMTLCILIPLHKQQIQKSMIEMHKRTCLFSMYLYSQLTIIICAMQTVLVATHVYYSQTLIKKIISYSVFGICFLVCLLFVTFSMAIVQKQLDLYFNRDSRYKFIIMMIALFVGLMAYPLFLTTFHKGIWFFYFCILGLLIQFIISFNRKLMPYSRFVVLYALAILYLTLQTDQYPIANFHQHSIFSMTTLFLFLGAVILVGWLKVKKIKLSENVAQMFNLKIDKQNQSRVETNQNQKIIDIKSDIQLEEEITIS